MDEFVCRECDVVFLTRRFLKKHLRKVHGLCYKDYVIKYDYSGIHPMCACGCGAEVGWYNDLRFCKLINGHFTQEMRDAQSKRRKGKRLTSEQRTRMSTSSRAFYASDEGRCVAATRAIKLNEFHASEAGTQWSQEQSERLRTFNASEQGKEVRANAGKKVSDYYQNNPDAREQKSLNARAWHASEGGKAFVARHIEHLREFYKTPQGKQVIAEMVPKIRAANLLKRNEFDQKIAYAFSDTLEPISAVPSYHEYTGLRETFDHDFTVRCRACGFEHTRKLINIINIPKCMRCTATLTKPQIELAECIHELGYDVVLNERNVIAPKEIDVWVPSHRVAIEYNGLYWHCKDNRTSLHVEEKLQACNDCGIRLVVVFEDEWRERRHAVLSNICSALNANNAHTVSHVVDVHDDAQHEFFESFHVLGDVSCSFSLGAQVGDDLVAVMSFCVCDGVANLVRYASHPTLRLANAPHLLVSETLKRYDTVVAELDPGYCDIEEFVNFADTVTTTPMFWWTDFVSRSIDHAMFVNRPNVKQIFGAHTRTCVFTRKDL